MLILHGFGAFSKSLEIVQIHNKANLSQYSVTPLLILTTNKIGSNVGHGIVSVTCLAGWIAFSACRDMEGLGGRSGRGRTRPVARV